MRKKRLLIMVAAVVCCTLFVFVFGYIMMRADKEEYAKWQASYKGKWVSANGDYQLTVRRVTGAHIIFSIENKQYGSLLPCASGMATGDGEYVFYYDIEAYKDKNVDKNRICYGNRFQGNISLKEKKIEVNVVSASNHLKNIGFQGELKRKSDLPKIQKEDLLDRLGTEIPKDYKDGTMPYHIEQQNGRVSRVHIIWDNDRDNVMADKYIVDDMNAWCMLFDLETKFGSPISEEQLDNNRYKRVYENEQYRYQFITDGYGVVVEADCQYRSPLKGKREGDFIVEGDTVLRYLGDYEKQRKITLPKGTKKIATGAFSVGDATLSKLCTHVTELKIPKDVKVEPGAFRDCGKLRIVLEQGWTTVEPESFAYMVAKEKKSQRLSWVRVELPRTMRRLKKNAFLTEGEIDEMQKDETAVNVLLNNELEYIEDDALKGIVCDNIPDHLIELGTNFYYSNSNDEYDEYDFPTTLKRIARSTLFSPGRWVIINGEIPEMYGKLSHPFSSYWEEREGTNIEYYDEKKYDDLINQLSSGQNLTEGEREKLEKILLDDDDWYDDDWYDDDWYDDDWY